MKHLCVLFAIFMLSGLLFSCKKVEEDGHGGHGEAVKATPAPSPKQTPAAPTKSHDASLHESRELKKFDLALLMDNPGAEKFLVQPEPIIAFLNSERERFACRTTLIIECADEKTRSEILEKARDVQKMLKAALEELTPLEALSIEGKMRFKEIVIERLKNLLDHKAVKEVYYKDFVVEPKA